MDTQFVSTFEEACKKLNREPVIPEFLDFPEDKRPREKAAWELDVIMEANNGDWKPDIKDTRQKKWHPWFWIIDDEQAPLGFRLSFYGAGYDDALTFLGCRHAAKSEELAIFMGKQRPDLYAIVRG